MGLNLIKLSGYNNLTRMGGFIRLSVDVCSRLHSVFTYLRLRFWIKAENKSMDGVPHSWEVQQFSLSASVLPVAASNSPLIDCFTR